MNKIRFSEAGRLGAMTLSECSKDFFQWEGGIDGDSPLPCAGCFVGGALFAGGARKNDWMNAGGADPLFHLVFPEIPRALMVEASAKHLSGQSRESIADWVEQEENRLGLYPVECDREEELIAVAETQPV